MLLSNFEMVLLIGQLDVWPNKNKNTNSDTTPSHKSTPTKRLAGPQGNSLRRKTLEEPCDKRSDKIKNIYVIFSSRLSYKDVWQSINNYNNNNNNMIIINRTISQLACQRAGNKHFEVRSTKPLIKQCHDMPAETHLF